MQVSATVLGRKYGLTGQEMNRLLVKLGYLTGEPGYYDVTEKAAEYAVEKSFHRGCGGYSRYNRYWTTRTFDDSITQVLVITPELINEVRNEAAAARLANIAARKAAQAEAEAKFLADQAVKQAAEIAAKEAAEREALAHKLLVKRWKTAGAVVLVVSGVCVIGYGIYKLVPIVKQRFEKCTEEKEHICY